MLKFFTQFFGFFVNAIKFLKKYRTRRFIKLEVYDDESNLQFTFDRKQTNSGENQTQKEGENLCQK